VTQSKLLDRLARVPAPVLSFDSDVLRGMEDSVRYLSSEEALRSIEANPYWPKWDSPWWHMVTSFELGAAATIPQAAVRTMVNALNALPIKIFPVRPEDLPAGSDLRQTPCHCQLGSMAQVLAACGVDTERELPWISAWLLRYQMADGGLSCDSAAYRVEGECPSSMVGTISPLEAMLIGLPPSAGGDGTTPERARFVDTAASFLIERRLMLGSRTHFNAAEREREPLWLQPCFPRLYFYDVLRGASALTRWAELREGTIPLGAVEPVVTHLLEAFPDGVVRVQRRSFEGVGTRVRDASGTWTRGPASSFPLLEATSRVGNVSPSLTRQWLETRQRLVRLLQTNQITA
jgi:hypothetical protein